MTQLEESSLNIVSEGTRIEGKILFDDISRVHGVLIGEVLAKEGSTLILGETSLIEGQIQADTLIIDGFVKGNISARTKVVISSTGRVIGDIQSPVLSIEYGGYFEGVSKMHPSPISTSR